MLTQTSEYALRAMVYLARKGENHYAGVKEIASATDVPSNYLAKILQQLARARVLDSQKGFGGGFRISPSCSRLLHVTWSKLDGRLHLRRHEQSRCGARG